MPQTRIFLEGDSTTYGYGDTKYGGWGGRLKVNMMKRAANGETPAREVINLAVSAQALDQITDRFSSIARTYQRIPNVGVFMVGLIDSEVPYGQTGPRVPLLRFQDHLQILGDICVNNQVSPIIIGYYRVDEARTNPWRNGAQFTNSRLDEYRSCVAEYSDSNKMPYVDLTAIPNEVSLSSDGLHPSSNGHETIYKAVAPVVDQLLPAL